MKNISILIDNIVNFEKLSQKEQVKLVSFFHCIENGKDSFKTSDIKKEFQKNFLHLPSNISNDLKNLKNDKILINNKIGEYSFQRSCFQKLEEQYLGKQHIKDTSIKLRNLLVEINNNEQKKFLEEAINCFEIGAFRSSIVMTWLLIIDILYEFVLLNENINSFNKAIQSHGKYKKIKINTKDDFGNIKEVDFIELLKVSRLITNDTRKILDEKLGIRNSCAHPNTIIIEDYKAINFIQDLIINIVKKFSF